ncbi:Organic hydroperoxide resistance protein OhrB [Andreprevotia sp. IGB-42]|uniref:organic hydroperoxide resistance protein n=1 Tax=Andreprevotia sp. IGB-42 TaxID=2497473 RepID=UPI00135CBC61|nr:organic hydroperoxide resistance protein [Andreprevotia sp. IGB-42]KAF0813352.1 Organic hydroperoxide resistance protein OhrB [Andreprevotia sp. IGB-42]
MTTPLYIAEVTARGGRDGRIKSTDGVLDLKLASPEALGGEGGAATNPEQLFAAGYAACFESAIRSVASHHGVKITNSEVTARVGIGRREPHGFELAITLLVVLPGVDPIKIRELADIAHRDICPYSHATRGNIDVKIEVH